MYLNYKMLADNITAEILLMQDIGKDEIDDAGIYIPRISSSDFNATLDSAEGYGNAKKFKIRINSGGGDLFEAIAIYNAIESKDADIYVEGVAASCASLIAMAGKKIFMYDNSFLMIHNPLMGGRGDAEYFAKVQELLSITKNPVISAYMRSGMSEDEIRKMMSVETWLSAQDALAKKFCDEIIPTGMNRMDTIRNYFTSFLKNEQPKKGNKMQKIQNKLGMTGANEDEIVNAIDALKVQNSALDKTVKENKVKMDADAAELETLRKEKEAREKLAKDEADAKAIADATAIVDKAVVDMKITPAQIESAKDHYIAMARKDKTVFDKWNVLGPVKVESKTDDKPVAKRGDLKKVVAEMHSKTIGKK